MTTEFGGGTRFAGGFGTGHIIEDEGTPLAQRVTLNFLGTGVTATDNPANNATDVTIAAGGHVIEDEGTPLAQRANLNFVGAGVTAADSGGKTVVTIPGGGGYDTVEDEGTPLAQETVLNFVGAGVTATAGTGETVVTIPGGASVLGTQQTPINAAALYPEVGTGEGANPIAQRAVGTFGQQVKYIEFPPVVDSFAYFDWFPPRNWDAGAISVRVFWTSEFPSVAGQTPEIQMGAVALAQDNIIGATDFGGPNQIIPTLSDINEVQTFFNTGPAIAGGPAKGDWVQVKIRRKGSGISGSNDNMAGPFQFLGLLLEYTIDSATSTG